ncbi:hypothetical protein [Modestobacter italicus]|uniref:hypothetical protein n=1 Tax=Modestobacter italicus (strain DSM 44449 / CECT 9708 / BC 501) TaxID=2732864 RepID=UPI001C985DB4|nr:hypothetical protein [Modestobacter italicus]
MPARLLLARTGLALLVLTGGVLAAVGGVSLGPSGLVAVVLAAVVAGCLGAGIARDGDGPPSRQAALDAAWHTAAVTVAALLLLSGSVVVAGGAVTLLLVAGVLGGLLARWALRSVRGTRRAGVAPVMPLHAADGGWARRLSVPALGQEWVRSSAALPVTWDPAARQELVRRRQEALDELERRDPAGFARWLADGATVDSDPAEYVSGDPAAGSDAA